MPNSLDATGLTIKTRAEIIDEMLNGASGVPGLLEIYGPDINTDPNSPDGQLLNLIAQIAIDYAELLASVYASFDPDQASGIDLDLRCAINGVVRHDGTYTTQLVRVTATQALVLAGIDTSPESPFTIQDSAGNQFQLIAAHTFAAAGNANLDFQSSVPGAVIVSPSTLTTIVSVQLGVASVTNASLAGTTGTNEETDYALRIRRAKSVALPSKGYLEGLLGALLAVDGVTSAIVYENPTGSEVDTIPAHSIWCVVTGGEDVVIGLVIYNKRNAGCGMKGATTVEIEQLDGNMFQVAFDRSTPETLWIKFSTTAVTGTVDNAYIEAQLLLRLSYTINQQADASAIVSLVKEISPNVSIAGCLLCATENGSYVELLSNSAKNNQWAIAASRITIT
jgi:uncharacterized phage protein gp47/JayE